MARLFYLNNWREILVVGSLRRISGWDIQGITLNVNWMIKFEFYFI